MFRPRAMKRILLGRHGLWLPRPALWRGGEGLRPISNREPLNMLMAPAPHPASLLRSPPFPHAKTHGERVPEAVPLKQTTRWPAWGQWAVTPLLAFDLSLVSPAHSRSKVSAWRTSPAMTESVGQRHWNPRQRRAVAAPAVAAGVAEGRLPPGACALSSAVGPTGPPGSDMPAPSGPSPP